MLPQSVRALAVGLVVALVLSSASVAAGLSQSHPTLGQSDLTPVSPNAIEQIPGYRVSDSCVNVCHGAQAACINNNHGMYLRPITGSTSSVFSFNPYWNELPSAASFTFGVGDPNRASWIIGGLAIGAERYIYQGTQMVGPDPVTFPQIGDRQWAMDYDRSTASLPKGVFIPGMNRQSQLTTAWANYNVGSTVNYFTGSSNLTPTAADYGCVNCHAFGATIAVDELSGLPTSYQIEEWGVTCVNCHGNNPAQAHNPETNPVPFNSDTCYRCHQREPVAGSPGVPARAQQLTQGIWGLGMSKNHRDQGTEVRKPRAAPGPFVPGTVETTSGAGHPASLSAIQSFAQQRCLRCHTTEGYIAHSLTGTDTPYSFTLQTGLGRSFTYSVDKNTSHGVDCAACHSSHGSELGYDETALRIPAENSYDAGSPSDPMFRACTDCHRESGELLPYGGQFNYVGRTRMSHPQREMFLGYGGYGVSQVTQPHVQVGAWCQYCHMPVTTSQPEADRTHLFRIVMPGKTLSTVDVPWDEYPAGATRTDPVVKTPAAFPDDSCTGNRCHLPNATEFAEDPTAAQDALKQFLQETTEQRQQQIADLLDEANTLMDDTSYASNTTAWLQARINVWMVETDGSYGMHNFFYAKALLDTSINTFENIQAGVSPANVTIAVSNTAPAYNQRITVTGTLKNDASQLVGGRALVLQSSQNGTTWATVNVVGSLTGNYTYSLSLASARYLRWAWMGDDTLLAAQSAPILVKPYALLDRPRASRFGVVYTTSIRANLPYTMYGYLRPQYPAGATNVHLQFSRWTGSAWTSWTTRPTVNVNNLSRTRYTRQQNLGSPGTWRARAYFPETTGNRATYSSIWQFRVRP